MSRSESSKRKSTADFWRACRYLWPHRRLVLISVVCALVVGAAFTGGMSTMLPILRVLIQGDTVSAWLDRQGVADRMGVKLVEDPELVQISQVGAKSPAQDAGITPLQQISYVTLPPDTALTSLSIPADVYARASVPLAPTLQEDDRRLHASAVLAVITDPVLPAVQIHLLGVDAPKRVTLNPLPTHLALGQNLANRLPADPVMSIAAVFGLLTALSLFGNFVRFFQEYLSEKAAVLAVTDIRRQLYDHAMHLPLGYFSVRGTSDANSRMVQDATALFDGFRTVLGKAIQEPIKIAMTFGLALYLSWKLTLFIVLFTPIMFLLIDKFGRKMRRASRRMLQSASRMMGQLEGSMAGVRAVKAASAERIERRKYTSILNELNHEQFKMSKIDAMSDPIIESLTLILAGVIILVSAYMVLKTHSLDAGTFIMVMACLAGMADSLRKISRVNSALQKSNAGAQRVFEMLSSPVETRRALSSPLQLPASPRQEFGLSEVVGQSRKLPPISREVRFENVNFYYPGSTVPAVADLDLVVPRGQSVAVVGRNGSGKTTLLGLLTRFYDPTTGRVMIDGVDVRQATLRSLRGQIAVVSQDSVVFPGTIMENIAYGYTLNRIDRQRVEEAARRAFAHEFILEKPKGYDTVLGEHGAQLSGGQKQRLCIARAIYRQSPILILDEATSQIDAESEHFIQQAIESLMKERTTFVIAHRFSTILSADRIIVLERGRIIGQGKHEELLTNCPIYGQLYERQLVSGGVGGTTAAAIQ